MANELHTAEVRDFIENHKDEKPHELALKARKYPHLPIKYIAHQIQCYQKAKVKLPNFSSIMGIIYPPGISLEQSSSESTAIYKSKVIQGASLTDLTGGFGIDSYYFSKVFEEVNYVEQQTDLPSVVEHNFNVLGITNVNFYSEKAEVYLEKLKSDSDCYFLDPARRDAQSNKVFEIQDCTPDLNKILPLLLARDKVVLVKMSPMLDIQQALSELPNVSEVHVVAVNNECKELLFKIESKFSGHTNIRAVNITSTGQKVLSFFYNNEEELPLFSQPLDYIYEPNVAIMKAGGFNTVAREYGLNKLHRNSQLYTSSEHIIDFPGRVFKLQAVTTLNKKKLKSWLPDNKANITVRNYPESVKMIRKKTGIKEGGQVYLFATTLLDNSLKTLVCEKVKLLPDLYQPPIMDLNC